MHPKILLLKQKHGYVEDARVAFEILRNELVLGLLDVILKQANFEHRQGNADAACATFDAALQSEKLKEEPLDWPQTETHLDSIESGIQGRKLQLFGWLEKELENPALIL
uniref:Uncharacterized protein n=1 Tax=Physcomitrium patens TaxID=3218 RepID=A0A2K1JW69_PHYPA|nr:hypothetical protein PHYPA_015537 [Physcomitrium patens]